MIVFVVAAILDRLDKKAEKHAYVIRCLKRGF